MFLPLEHFHVTHESGLLGFALIATEHESFVFLSCPVVMCGCAGPLAITVLFLNRRKQHKLFLYWATYELVQVYCFEQPYLQTLSRGLAKHSIAQQASNLFIVTQKFILYLAAGVRQQEVTLLVYLLIRSDYLLINLLKF